MSKKNTPKKRFHFYVTINYKPSGFEKTVIAANSFGEACFEIGKEEERKFHTVKSFELTDQVPIR